MFYQRSLLILLTGILAMLLSGIGGYYWASTSRSQARITQKSPPQTQSQQPNSQAVETSSGTLPLRADNWQSFLDYEGPRTKMLGVKKEYNAVNFRDGPGIEYEILATPESGSLLKILDRVGEWYRAQLKDGSIGWIHRSVVRILKVPQPIVNEFTRELPSLKEATEKRIPSDLKDHTRIRITQAKVNLRQGPGTQFTIIGQLYRYQQARLLGKRDRWYRIMTPNRSYAWIRSDLAEPVWAIAEDNQGTITVSTRDLRMGPEYQFRDPGTSNSKIEGKLLERQSPWYMVKLSNENIGWVHEKEVIQLPRDRTE